MHAAAQCLQGEQDFSAFRAAACQSKTPYRNVHAVRVGRVNGYVAVDITANAFLLHMVRNIAGACVPWVPANSRCRRCATCWMGETERGLPRRRRHRASTWLTLATRGRNGCFDHRLS